MSTNANIAHPPANTTARTQKAVTPVPVHQAIYLIPMEPPAGIWTSVKPANMSVNTLVLTPKAVTPALVLKDTSKSVTIVKVCLFELVVVACFRGVLVVDINECGEAEICPKPGRCVNILGSFRCICPRGFKLDSSGTYCVDTDECLDDSKCPEGE